MITFVPYKPEHLMLVELQPAQADWRARVVKPGYAESLVGPHSWTGFADGVVAGCAGVAMEREGLAKAWALLAAGHGRSWVPILRKMRAVLDASGVRRIEADVAADFGDGARLAQMLGFEAEGLRRGYGWNGEDFFLFARVRP